MPDASFLSVLWGNQDHTTLIASYLILDRPPWQAYLAKGGNFCCPQCGRRMGHTWHNTRSRGRQPAWFFGSTILMASVGAGPIFHNERMARTPVSPHAVHANAQRVRASAGLRTQTLVRVD